MSTATNESESVEDFRERSRAWIQANLRRLTVSDYVGILRPRHSEEIELAEIARERELQRMLFDAGLAGVCFPTEYGGLGLTPAHNRALNEELAGYEFPYRIQAPTFSPCATVLLEFGTEEQKRRHIPAMLRGEEIWMQLLSEPSGGSDVAAALTTAVRDGDEWVLNGSKVWTTGAWWSDWGLCLARTNWEVPKHRGLSVFIFPLNHEGVDVHRIEMLNGHQDFCQEFLSDLRIADTARVGEVDDGWTVGTRWMFHERMLHNSPYVTWPVGAARGSEPGPTMAAIARGVGRLGDPHARELIGEADELQHVTEALQQRLSRGIMTGKMSDQSATIGKIWHSLSTERLVSMQFELAGGAGVAWDDDDGLAAEVGNDYLLRQVAAIGGGTTEMARNGVAERVLGMPRERTHAKDLPFSQVPKGPSAR